MSTLLKQIDLIQEEINKYRPLSPHAIKELQDYYRIGLTYTSNALEGNSLTESETKIVLEEGITIGGKPLKDHFEAIGHAEAYDYLFELSKAKDITEKDVLKLHKLLYSHINSDKAGKYRTEQLFITGTDFVPPAASQVPALMSAFFKTIIKLKSKYHPVELAALFHKELVSIHPFVDGNGRTARLLMNLVLLQHGYVITIIPLILRNQYIAALRKAQVEPISDKPFLNFIAEMVYESQKDYLRLLKALNRK